MFLGFRALALGSNLFFIVWFFGRVYILVGLLYRKWIEFFGSKVVLSDYFVLRIFFFMKEVGRIVNILFSFEVKIMKCVVCSF